MTLQLQSNNGQFVHNNQTMAAGQGFKCVSKLWYDKTKSLDDGLKAIADDAAIRSDLMVPASNFRVEHRGNTIVLVIDGVDYAPTDYAWNQLAGKPYCNIGTSIVKELRNPMTYGKKIFERDSRDAELLAQCYMNGHRRLKADKVFRFRVDTNMVCRAVLTEDYSPISNVWYLETLQKFFKSFGGTEPRLSHWRGNADTVYGNLLIPDSCIEDTDSDYGGMVSMSNCEIGKRRLEQYPSIFRAICMNGCIWDQVKGTQISKVHRGEIDLADMRERIIKNITESIPLMPTIVAEFLKSKDKKLDKCPPAAIIAQIAKENGFTPKETREVGEQFVKFEADNRNLFGIVNAITRAGQVFDNDSWVSFDEIGGQLIMASEKTFTNLKDKAMMLTTEDINKIFGNTAA